MTAAPALIQEAHCAALNRLALPLCGIGAPCDFLSVEPAPVYDRVVANPPFEKQADIRHVLHALQFLKPGIGYLVSVISVSVTFRDNRLSSEFCELLARRGGNIEALPAGSFRQSGTEPTRKP